MKGKILMLLIIALALISVSAVSASDNATDIIGEDVEQADVPDVLEASDSEPVIANDSSEEPVVKETSKITSSKVTGYEQFKTKVTFKLTASSKPLASKKISINVNGATYNRITDKDGKVTLNLNLKKGTYTTQFSYAGDNSTTNATGKSSIVIKSPTKTKLKLGDKDINYRQGSKCLFYVKLLTKDGKPVKNQIVVFKVAGKTYKAKTNKNGVAKIFLNLKKGKHKVKYSFKKNARVI